MLRWLLNNAQANLLRALGNSVTPIVFLVVSSVCNIILDVLFIKAFGMGVKGTALATVICTPKVSNFWGAYQIEQVLLLYKYIVDE